MSLLEIDTLAGGYAAAENIVKGVSMRADAGEIVTIIGPNGAGKSTVLKLATGLLRPSAGHVRVGGVEVAGFSPQAIMQAGLGFVPQERNVFGALTVEENLLMGAFAAPRRAKALMEKIYARFPLLAERRRALGRTLSGGQRQILAMGVGLMGEPKALALDEPTAGLSPKAAQELFREIRALSQEGLAILMVEQNALDALAASDRAEVLVDGRTVRSGAARDIAEDPEIRRLFLGGRAA